MRDRSKLAVIHIAKKELGLSDEDYRALLLGACGVESAKDIADDKEFVAVMACFEKLGHQRVRPKIQTEHWAQWAKARALWGALHELGAVRVNTDGALQAFSKKIDRAGTSDGLTRVIEHLKKWRLRVETGVQHALVKRRLYGTKREGDNARSR